MLPAEFTYTCTLPAVAIADAGIAAINWFDVTNVVDMDVPAKNTMALVASLSR